MNDLISRQAAIELAMEYCPDDDGTVAKDGDIRELLDELENLPPTQPERKWIPVSERLPELDEDGYSQKVLACFENCPGCDILEYRATEGIGKWYIGDMDESPEDIGIMVLA